MNLPKLPDLNNDYESNKTTKAKAPKPQKNQEEKVKRKSIIPKSEYDSTGKPMLTIPDLDDINLKNEIEKYFGMEDD